MLCRYRHALGRPGEGVHSYRLFGVAVVDVALTILAAALFARFALGWALLSWRTAALTSTLFISGVAAHRLFCVRTRVDRLLFPDEVTA